MCVHVHGGWKVGAPEYGVCMEVQRTILGVSSGVTLIETGSFTGLELHHIG